jgi:hypothetical protein
MAIGQAVGTTRRIRTTRRADAAAGINLAQIRRWYAEGDEDGDDPGATGNDEFDLNSLPPAVRKEIQKLKNEARGYRKDLEKFQSEAARQAQERLQEEGRWKELAETRAADVAKLQPYQQRAETLETIIADGNKRRIERVPEDMRSLIPVDYPPERLQAWLDSNWDRLLAKPAPNLDAGVGGSGGGTRAAKVELTSDEKAMARRAGMTEAQYAETKQKAADQAAETQIPGTLRNQTG